MDGVFIAVSFIYQVRDNTKNLAKLLPMPPTQKVATLEDLMQMEPFTYNAYKEAQRMRASRSFFSSCIARVMCMMVVAQLTTISRMDYSKAYISYVFLNVSD